MDVLFCTSEAFPLVKTGGLGDVCGSLPRALHELGNDVRLILPAYPEVVERAGKLSAVASLTLTGASEPVEILRGQLPGSEVGLYLVDSAEYFRCLRVPLLHWPSARQIRAGNPSWCTVMTGRPGWCPLCCQNMSRIRPPCSAFTICLTRGCSPPPLSLPWDSRIPCGP